MQEEQQPQAGWVFTPGQQSPVAPAPEPQQQPQPDPVYQPQTPQPVQPAPVVAAANQDDQVSWTASEYIAHQKGADWFILLGLAAAGLAGVIYLLTRDVISPIVVVVVSIIFGSFAARKPQVLQYIVSPQGIKVGPKFYAYSNFKAFSVNEDNAIASINFLPVKRFMPGLTIHFEDQDGDRIIDALGDYLPLEEHKPEIIDRFMNKLRF